MKIAQLAPLWESVPPKTYGGTELVVYSLCEELHRLGHEVTLYASGDSQTSVELKSSVKKSLRQANLSNPMLFEIKAVADLLKDADKYDIIHNHIGPLFFPFASNSTTPTLTTLHGAFTVEDDIKFHVDYKHLPFISISDFQRKGAMCLNYVDTVYNGIDIERYPFNPEPDTDTPYLLFLGRISEEKGTHLSIQLALETGYRLIIAGKISQVDMDYYETQVKPYIDGKQIIYVGEVSHEPKCKLFKNAYATLHTITWPEPFGLVLAESMLCGTPVLALKDGSIPEVIKDGETGYIEDNINDLIKQVKNIDKIDRYTCRQHIEDNFSTERMAQGYLRAYQKTIKNWDSYMNESQEESLLIN